MTQHAQLINRGYQAYSYEGKIIYVRKEPEGRPYDIVLTRYTFDVKPNGTSNTISLYYDININGKIRHSPIVSFDVNKDLILGVIDHCYVIYPDRKRGIQETRVVMLSSNGDELPPLRFVPEKHEHFSNIIKEELDEL